jgi:hypothetical protein
MTFDLDFISHGNFLSAKGFVKKPRSRFTGDAVPRCSRSLSNPSFAAHHIAIEGAGEERAFCASPADVR